MEIWSYIIGLLPAVITGGVVFYLQRAQKRRDAKAEAHADARREEAILSLEMQMATAKLAYATAMAMKRGKSNGEVEEGIAAYEAAKTKYFDFMNKQAKRSLER